MQTMREGRVTSRPRAPVLAEAALAAAGMVAFALLLGAGVAGGVPAASGLVLAAAAFYLSLRSGERPADLFGVVPFPPRAWLIAAAGTALGIGLGAAYRWVWMPAPLPADLRSFVVVAMAIGAAEEVLYRGYVQGRLAAALGVRRPVLSGRASPTVPAAQAPRRTNHITRAHLARLVAAVVLAAAAHTAYKAALFVWPPAGVEIDYEFLILWTLAGGVAFGALRVAAGTVWPAVAAHAAFDLVAYGDAVRAPWWVWG